MKRLLGLVVVMLLASWPAAASGKHCSQSSLKGTYTYAFEPKAFSGGPFPLGTTVAAVVGTITFDGNGGFTGRLYQNDGSNAVFPPISFGGTYQVYRDCTYTSEFGGSQQFGIIAQQGEKLRVLQTNLAADNGFLLEFTAEKEPDGH